MLDGEKNGQQQEVEGEELREEDVSLEDALDDRVDPADELSD